MFQPSNYEEFTNQLQCDTELYGRMTVDNGVMVSGTGAGEVITVDVSGKSFNRMTDYRRWAYFIKYVFPYLAHPVSYNKGKGEVDMWTDVVRSGSTQLSSDLL